MPEPLRWLFKVFDVLVVVGMAVISLLIFTNVVLRYGFSSGIPFAVEVSRVVLVWVIFLGSVVALAKGAHLGVDSLVVRLPRRARFVCFLASYGLMLWCCWLLAKGSWSLTLIEWGNVQALSGIPVGAIYAAGLAAAILMALVLLIDLWRSLRGILPAPWSGEQHVEPVPVVPAALKTEGAP
ncbi:MULTISPECIES: TRAP transporter small permease [unclassified Chelatococcus]|uniref:TRAP transporter small permease n=1 Tax=unclassified Chelatococcus TaxID=2638111 RepID=UPI001BCE7B47|nr:MULTISPECIES: TRAP transporter small permease [unclassified Chelatococcus]CAH1658552.1 TRAP-type C4-dicarboxylate transport system permease small subunit [Hyphomicrobiales bacterium]MBS7740816.1 TRAP transporter small permease [Chelatococcus sp. HY11]MBX3545950.1 TRAP transporter small permease [Chelatococcus sp.]MCO5079576.1 TRAP transporter small permease [Chelatococcus sp.]CAH1684108.1 TRAP-type C4-dicarboxylate transport system permease small subunit [Hyphomicrobiales bacterium]